MNLDGVLRSVTPLGNLLRGIGNWAVCEFLHPMQTSVIDKESGKVIARYRSVEEYIPDDEKYLATRHDVIIGFRRNKK